MTTAQCHWEKMAGNRYNLRVFVVGKWRPTTIISRYPRCLRLEDEMRVLDQMQAGGIRYIMALEEPSWEGRKNG